MAEQQGAGLAFRFDPETKTLLASNHPQTQSTPIDEAWLHAQLNKMGWGNLRYIPTAVAQLLAQYQQGLAVTDLRLAEALDASLCIQISVDGLEATLDIVPAQGGEAIDEAKILDALGSQGVTTGVMLDAIQHALAADTARGIAIARGRPPIDGADGWLEYLQTTTRNRVPKIDEYGHTDYRDLGEILVVHAGDALIRRHPAAAGEAGLTLQGLPIPAKPGKDVQFAGNLSGAAVAPDQPDLLVATVDGQPVEVHNGMMVEPVFTIQSVNAASGNIRFDGNVVIKGDVLAGMTVQASGDIEVGGVVEPATLEAGGHIVIKGGVMGGLGHNHHLRCGGTFNAAYASQARIEAGDSIFICDSAVQCELSAVNCIRVGNKKSGHIVGGRIQATFSIVAKVIGSPKRVATRFEIGVNPVLHKHLQEIIKCREGKENQLFEFSKVLDFAHKHPEKVHHDAVEKVRKASTALFDEIAAIRAEQIALEQKIEHAQQSRVIAEQAIHEGVEVFLGGQRYQVSEEHGPGAIGIGQDGLGLLPLNEAPSSPSAA